MSEDQKFPAHLEPIRDQIMKFKESDKDTALLDHELTKNERYFLHSHIESIGLSSESIELKGTNNKKIRLLRHADPKDLSNRPVDSEDIDCFASNVGAPFPCTDPSLAGYYIEEFDPMFATKEKWDLFLSELRSAVSVKKESARTREKICHMIRDNPNYQVSQNLRLRGQSNRIRGDVYHHGSDGKTFVSLDIKSANFTCIRLICPEIFSDSKGQTISWSDFVLTLTSSKFVAQSKIFREIVFGKLGFAKSANVLQEAIMERVDQVLKADPVLSKIFNTDTIRMKCGDENVYELPDTPIVEDESEAGKYIMPLDLLLSNIGSGALQAAMRGIRTSEIPVLTQLFEALNVDADMTLGDIFHIRIFKVNKIGSKKYFVKTFKYRSDWDCQIQASTEYTSDEQGRTVQSPVVVVCDEDNMPLRQKIEFKRVDKKFYLQVLKNYQNRPIVDKDLYFTDSGIVAKYCHSIFE